MTNGGLTEDLQRTYRGSTGPSQRTHTKVSPRIQDTVLRACFERLVMRPSPKTPCDRVALRTCTLVRSKPTCPPLPEVCREAAKAGEKLPREGGRQSSSFALPAGAHAMRKTKTKAKQSQPPIHVTGVCCRGPTLLRWHGPGLQDLSLSWGVQTSMLSRLPITRGLHRALVPAMLPRGLGHPT